MTDCSTKMMENKQNNRIYSFSYIRALACIAIVVLHTAYSASVLCKNAITEYQDIVSKAVTNCMMWAVPCFIMVTGALLLDESREITYHKLFHKYILRVLGALVLYCIIFRVFDIIMDKEEITVQTLLTGFYEIFTGTSWSHMWYLYLVIGLYLLLPFYKKIVNYSTEKELKYLLAVYVVFLSILPLLRMWELNCGFYIHVSTIYPFYLFCGYMVHKNKVNLKKPIAILTLILSTVLIAGLTAIRWKYDIQVMESLWGYSSILVILQAVSCFSLMDGWKKEVKVLIKIDEHSFGIYLIHVLFIRLVLRYMSFDPYKNGGIIAFLALVLGNLAISYLVTWILKRIPVFSKIL